MKVIFGTLLAKCSVIVLFQNYCKSRLRKITTIFALITQLYEALSIFHFVYSTEL